ncbi:MAG: M15 family metallopeptidase, partial [bacterium]
MKISYFLILIFLVPFYSFAQQTKENPYNLTIVSDTSQYNAECMADSNNRLVDLARYIPTLQLDIVYATDENFTGAIIYTEPKAYARLPVAKALSMVQAELQKQEVGLKIYDAYRPYSATLKLWELIGDTQYVAPPWKGSRHNRGCAVDVSLFDLISGDELDMPTPFDDFTSAASPSYSNLPSDIMENRQSLINLMQEYGFTVNPFEWWHFD